MPTLTIKQWDEYQAIIKKCEALKRENQQFKTAAQGLVSYRDKAGALNFQLEKADYFIWQLRRLVEGNHA